MIDGGRDHLDLVGVLVREIERLDNVVRLAAANRHDMVAKPAFRIRFTADTQGWGSGQTSPTAHHPERWSASSPLRIGVSCKAVERSGRDGIIELGGSHRRHHQLDVHDHVAIGAENEFIAIRRQHHQASVGVGQDFDVLDHQGDPGVGR